MTSLLSLLLSLLLVAARYGEGLVLPPPLAAPVGPRLSQINSSILGAPFMRRLSFPRRTCKPISHNFGTSLSISNDSSASAKPPSRNKFRNLPLQRPHERTLFLFYALGAIVPYLYFLSKQATGGTSSTCSIHLFVPAVQAVTSLVWSSFIMAISFMEAWVKFRAPFLRKYIAVDVGRHVFAALNAVELGLALAMWLGRSLVAHAAVGAAKLSLVLPAVATTLLLIEAFYISPKLHVRAKAQIVKEMEKPGGDDNISSEEVNDLRSIQEEIKIIGSLPSPRWHVVYVALELIKVICLGRFVATVWSHAASAAG